MAGAQEPAPVPERRGGRRKARELVLRATYESEVTGDPVLEVLELSLGKFRMTLEGREYALRLAQAVSETWDEAREAISRFLEDWSFERLGLLERSVMRVAYAELRACRDVAAAVILDEAVRLAIRYVGEEAGGFVNGVLDRLARELRPRELEEGGSA
jgi:N utilization substance protein B